MATSDISTQDFRFRQCLISGTKKRIVVCDVLKLNLDTEQNPATKSKLGLP